MTVTTTTELVVAIEQHPLYAEVFASDPGGFIDYIGVLDDSPLSRAEQDEIALAAINILTAEPSKWIDSELLARFPNGPFAVYGYNPKVGREVVTRNQSAASATRLAELNTARGLRVHVSLDTCG